MEKSQKTRNPKHLKEKKIWVFLQAKNKEKVEKSGIKEKKNEILKSLKTFMLKTGVQSHLSSTLPSVCNQNEPLIS